MRITVLCWLPIWLSQSQVNKEETDRVRHENPYSDPCVYTQIVHITHMHIHIHTHQIQPKLYLFNYKHISLSLDLVLTISFHVIS